jgi:RNA polymerase sigma factor (sigma-70 family)
LINAERELIALLKQGNPSAFKTFFESHQAKVYNTALSYLQNETDAEEILQEVFLEAFKSIHAFNEQSLLATWLYRITINKCIDYSHYKKRKKRFAVITSLFSSKENEAISFPKNFEHPGVIAENKELSQLLFAAINQLPENQKAAFILSKIEGQSQKEMAAILQLNEKAIESLLQRAKTKLREILADYFDEHYKK